MMVNLSELTPLAKKLNQKSDELNSVISTINEKLNALNLGIEVWTSTPIQSGDYEYDHDTEPPQRYREVVYLGYAEVGDEWQLAVKEALLETREDDNGRQYEDAANPKVRPLASASRRLRTAAMAELPDLLNGLKYKAEQLISAIDAGKKAADSL